MTSSSATAASEKAEPLPVIIVGAGPCGLVVAATLRRYGIPFVIIERAARHKICSNAGSGFEFAPTSIEILKNRLGIDISKILSAYNGMTILTVEGRKVRHSRLPADYAGGSVNRAELQKHLLGVVFPSAEEEEGVLFCGSGIESYREEEEQGRVVATLVPGDDGGPEKTIAGCVLLACDGIHSRCRAVMHGGYESSKSGVRGKNSTRDPLHFCNTMAYWGKVAAPEGSDLQKEWAKTQRTSEKDGAAHCTSFVFGLATSRAPAGFFIVPSHNGTMLNWAVTIYSKAPQVSGGNDGSDLTRRGGGVLTEQDKERLFAFGSHGSDSESVVRGVKKFPLLEQLIESTPAQDITEAGLYDRENLDLPYSSEKKLVALLGDAAHPQSPYLGQGVNMAITDAYVYATSIAFCLRTGTRELPVAIADCDTARRRKQAGKVIRGARLLGNLSISTSPIVSRMMRLYGRFAPTEEFVHQIVKTDKSNRDYLRRHDRGRYGPKELEKSEQGRA